MKQLLFSTFLFTLIIFSSCKETNESTSDEASNVKEIETSINDEASTDQTTASTEKANNQTIEYFEGEIPVHEIDQKLKECLDQHGSGYGMQDCTYKALEAWDASLNKFYKIAMNAAGENEKIQLRAAQREWIKFKEAEGTFISQALYGFDGSLYKLLSLSDQLEITKWRTIELISKQFHAEGVDEVLFKFVDDTRNELYPEVETPADCSDLSNMGMRLCAKEKAEYFDGILNEYYNKLMAELNEDGAAMFKKAQKSWLAFRDAEAKTWDGIYEDMGGGSMYPTMKMQQYAGLVKVRALTIKEYYKMYLTNKEEIGYE